jgi:probable rRNA maturation factor
MDDETSAKQITVQIAQLCDKVQADTAGIEKLVRTVCKNFDLHRAVISIAIVDDEHICKINEQFLENKQNTDCLSFDLSDNQEPNEKCFEIIVNAELADRRAEEMDHSSEAELALYITHGLLHQFGYDDQTDEQAEKMHRAAEQILQQLGYDFVYN